MQFLISSRFWLAAGLGVLLIGSISCTKPAGADSDKKVSTNPPVAMVKPEKLEKHGHERTDNYFWMRERDTPEVLEYLAAENTYADSIMAPHKALETELFEELKSRVAQDDVSAPLKKGNYFYYDRYVEGSQYPLYCRKKGSMDAEEEIILDANKMAEGHSFFSVRGLAVSPDENILAFAMDTVGRRIHNICFKNLSTGELLPDKIENSTSNFTWANDNKTVFYTRNDAVTLRSNKIFRHELGTEIAEDKLIFEETDDIYSCFIFKSRSEKYLMIASQQTLSSELRILEADNPNGEFRVFHPREKDHLYEVDHHDGRFFVLSNRNAPNFKLMETPEDKTGESNWKEVIAHRDDVLITGYDVFKDYLTLRERSKGLTSLRIRALSDNSEHYVSFDESAYVTWIGGNHVFDTDLLRIGYSSLTTPATQYDYNMKTRDRVQIKQQEVKGEFDPAHYATQRIYAKARDGVEVPISLVYKKDLFKQGTNPILVYGYGSYGITRDPAFSRDTLALLNRGFVYAIAHIRGSQMLGRQWYEDGKLLKKMNTFTDFIDCTKFLIDQKYGASDKVFARGGSAGGLLMGAVLNLEPTLYKGVISVVPFVDVITTMLDDSIPLTTGEFDEWGNPNDKTYYDYMLSYSPYDNVKAVDYTNLLVITGYHDSQVQYWEPAKWVAKLRAMKTDNNLLMLKTNMDAGHGGASGRFNELKERAFEFAFLTSLAND